MRNVIEVRYPLEMQFELEMTAREFKPNWRSFEEGSPYVKFDDPLKGKFHTTRLQISTEVILLHFHDRYYVHHHELLEELQQRKLRSLEFHEHIAFMHKYPKEAGEFTIVSFGSALHLDCNTSPKLVLKNGLFTYPKLGQPDLHSLRWEASVPADGVDSHFGTGGNSKFYFGCVPL